ncbi:MAG: hypothetical protein KJZ87_24365 [Thermoguttaceae bacterium]|nr:hypothetical protein [Thermoguttaceae bacterium]
MPGGPIAAPGTAPGGVAIGGRAGEGAIAIPCGGQLSTGMGLGPRQEQNPSMATAASHAEARATRARLAVRRPGA